MGLQPVWRWCRICARSLGGFVLTIVTPDVPRTDDHEEAPPFDTRVVLKTTEKGKRA